MSTYYIPYGKNSILYSTRHFSTSSFFPHTASAGKILSSSFSLRKEFQRVRVKWLSRSQAVGDWAMIQTYLMPPALGKQETKIGLSCPPACPSLPSCLLPPPGAQTQPLTSPSEHTHSGPQFCVSKLMSPQEEVPSQGPMTRFLAS